MWHPASLLLKVARVCSWLACRWWLAALAGQQLLLAEASHKLGVLGSGHWLLTSGRDCAGGEGEYELKRRNKWN